MGLLTSIEPSNVDPFDFSGKRAGRETLDAASDSAAILRRFFDKSQANLKPFLDLANRSLPGLEDTATVGGSLDIAKELLPVVGQLNEPLVEDQLTDLNSMLGSQGLRRSGFAAKSAADIEQNADLALVLKLAEEINRRRQGIAGFGTQSGTKLGYLGQQSAEHSADILGGAQLAAGQATAQGQQNMINGATTILSYFNDGGA